MQNVSFFLIARKKMATWASLAKRPVTQVRFEAPHPAAPPWMDSLSAEQRKWLAVQPHDKQEFVRPFAQDAAMVAFHMAVCGFQCGGLETEMRAIEASRPGVYERILEQASPKTTAARHRELHFILAAEFRTRRDFQQYANDVNVKRMIGKMSSFCADAAKKYLVATKQNNVKVVHEQIARYESAVVAADRELDLLIELGAWYRRDDPRVASVTLRLTNAQWQGLYEQEVYAIICEFCIPARG